MDEKNNQKYLISIGIGPVQDFISSARRSRDLWFGSWLLSELSKAAANEIVKEHKSESLIFPFVADPNELNEDSDFNVVNKIVALVEEPEKLAATIEAEMQRRLNDIRVKAYQSVKGFFPEDLQKKAESQVKDLVEFFWTAVKIGNPKDADEYEKAREQVEYLFAARKATRNFISTKEWSGNVPKSALDGQRESVIHEDVYKAVREKKMTKDELRRQFGVREGERLCGVGLLKRHGNRKSRINSTNDNSFFSTSHVAALPLITSLNIADKSAVDKYINELRNLGLNRQNGLNSVPLHNDAQPNPVFGRYDGHLLFVERLKDYFEDKSLDGKQKLESAKQALLRLRDDLQMPEPSPYYALLLADGDAMGKAIDAQKSKKEHQDLSAELSAFARIVRKIVENRYNGSLVYAGGDDVLAFVPLHTILRCAKFLAYIFKRKLRRFKITDKDKTYSPTLSVGIAVAHHLEPLEDALELARKAEKAAKAVQGKNALAVIVDKRSGTSRMLKGRWGTIDKRLNQFVEWHLDKEALNSAAYQLKDLANRLEVSSHISDEDRKVLQEAKYVEAKRILERKKINETALSDLKTYLADIREVLKKEFTDNGGDEKKFTDKSVEVLADELIIAKIFADATRLSQPKKEKKDE